MMIEGVLTQDVSKWEEALRQHVLHRYSSEAHRRDTNSCLEELRDTCGSIGVSRNTVGACPIDMGLLLRARARLRDGKAT
eukprot:8164558-Pyramimonas_sp.AAC.1